MKNFLIQNPIILGGFIPMLLFGMMAFPIKILSGKIHFSYYIFLTGLGVTLVGILCILFLSQKDSPNATQILWSIGGGVFWGIGNTCIFLALLNPKTGIAQLAPLYNINTLIAVLVGIFFFAEWQNLVAWKTLLGAIFVILGGWLVI